MKIPNVFKNTVHPITVSVIGVGGTGSLVLPRLARMDYALQLLGHPGLMVFAYDDDKVEEFNVGRQNFSDCDFGKNKAVALIEKCNLAFGLSWSAKQRKYQIGKETFSNIHIICVDNADFRVEYYKNKPMNLGRHPYEKHIFTIDCGNGANFGQVVITDFEELKTPIELFPDMLNQDNKKDQGIAGCSYEDSLTKQDLFINDIVSVEACNILWKLFRENEIESNGIIINSVKQKSLPIKIK